MNCRITFTCAFDQVRPAAASIRSFLTVQGCATDDLDACELALVEAVNNAVQHTPLKGRKEPVIVETLCEPGAIELCITDHTPGFEWPAKINLPELDSENGRGLYLITTLMQSAHYVRGTGENRLVMRRRRATSPPVPKPMALPAELAACHLRLAENEQIIGPLVEELSSAYESLSAIFRHGAEQAHAANLKDYSQRLLQDLLRILGADWFVLRVVPEGGTRLEVFVATEQSLQLESLPLPCPAGVSCVETTAAATGQDVWFGDRQPLGSADPLGHVRCGSSGLVHPLFLSGKLIGTLAVGRTHAPKSTSAVHVAFTAGQTSVIGTFGDFLAIQIVQARFQEQLAHNRVLARELEIAKAIQQSLLPQSLPVAPGFSLAASCESATQVGGDFYDILPVNEHTLMVVIADVMGKGVPGAMFAAILRTLLRAAPGGQVDPAALLTRVNQILFPDLSTVDMFITVQLALVDCVQRRLTVASAGHCPLMLSVPGESAAYALAPEGMPLGVLPDTPYAQETVDLPPGARVLLYTDGLTEALDASGERFGQERLRRWWHEQATGAVGADTLRALLTAELARFRGDLVAGDDQTLLILAG